MSSKISKRLLDIVDDLPLNDGLRILEVGCGTGAMAREIVRRYPNSYIMGIDRSDKAINQALRSSTKEIEDRRLTIVEVAIEDFSNEFYTEQFDIAIAIRVGALDGRHPKLQEKSMANIANALKPKGKLYIGDGVPLKEIVFDS